jgi:hypothetical protein
MIRHPSRNNQSDDRNDFPDVQRRRDINNAFCLSAASAAEEGEREADQPSNPLQPTSTHVTHASHSLEENAWVACVPQTVIDAIAASLPSGPDPHNRKIFELARRLKAIPGLDDSLEFLKMVVRKWHSQSPPAIHTQPFQDSWLDFQTAWVRVVRPYGSVLQSAFQAACRDPLLPIDGTSELGKLAALCRNLSVATGGGSFFLSCRSVEQLFGVSRMTAWRWLGQLVFVGVIKAVQKGSKRSRRATTWIFIGERG